MADFFVNGVFKSTFLNERYFIFWKEITDGLIDDKSAYGWWNGLSPNNIGSGNGLVPSGNKPLPEPMLTGEKPLSEVMVTQAIDEYRHNHISMN